MEFDRVRRAARGRRDTAGILSAPTARTVFQWTPADYVQASAQADSGSLARAADFCSAIMRDDRAGGVLEQRCEGMLSLPGRFEPCDAADPVALSEWPGVFPEAERAALLRWGVVLGVGFARAETIRSGSRWLREIHTWHAGHFDQDADGQWWVNATEGRRRVDPGQGWIVYTPFGRHQPTQRGLWHRLAVPFLAKTYAIDDRARSGEVTPILVAETAGLTEPQRRNFLADLQGLARDSRVVLPEGCKLGVVDRSGSGQHSIHEDTITWADTAITITIAGQKVTTEGAPGFSAGGTQRNILHAVLRHQEETFSTCLGEQALTPWLRLSTGYGGPTIYPRHDVSDPETLASKAYAITTLAPSIATMDQALAPTGQRVDVIALLEQAGVPLAELPASTGAERPSVALAPTDLVAVVSVNEARAAAGLGPLLAADGTPDPAGLQSVALYRAALEAGAVPGAVADPSAPATPNAVAPAVDGAAGALGSTTEDPGPDNDTAAEREAFAARMTELGAKVCQHRRTQCDRCGVERVATVDLDATGAVVHPVAWRARAVALGALVAASAPSRTARLVACNAIEGGPPDRFLIFRWGENATDHGTVTVTREGIARAQKRIGTRRLAIDLEHLSIRSIAGEHYDPDARGSFVLSTDAEGVWATDVRWTEDGAKRITERRQIYTSPAVHVDASGVVVGILNVALVAQPATQDIAPLIAASQGSTMDDEQLIMFLRTLAGLKPEASNDEIAAAVSAKFTGQEAPKPEKAPEPAPEGGDAPPAMSALSTDLRGVFGVATDAEILAAAKGAAASVATVKTLSAQVAELTAERVAREREQVIASNASKFAPSMLTWARTQTPEALRAFAATAPDLTSEHLTAPPAPTAETIALSAAELAACKRYGTDPDTVLSIKRRNAQKGS